MSLTLQLATKPATKIGKDATIVVLLSSTSDKTAKTKSSKAQRKSMQSAALAADMPADRVIDAKAESALSNSLSGSYAASSLAASILGADAALGQRFDNLLLASQITGKMGETALSYGEIQGTHITPNMLVVGLGEQGTLSANGIEKAAKAIYQSLSKISKTAHIILPTDTDIEFDDTTFGQFVLALLNQSYQFDRYKSKKADKPRLTHIVFSVAPSQQDSFQSALDFAQTVFAGQSYARDLANEPPNVCFPAYLAEQAQALAASYPELLTVKVIGEKQMQKLGMNCFLGVSKGSDHEGQLVVMEYNGSTKPRGRKPKNPKKNALEHPIVILGKGITFDTGGISLKPSLGMGEMKYDMGGAAAVLGMMKALCQARLPLQVVGAMACAENMPSGRASRPGDIVTAMNGTTVEILNTDAEGRLVLCDSLVYLQRYQPKVMIDLATLTGACVVALGHIRTGLYSNDEDVLFDLQAASETAHDRVWHMPLDDDYHEQLKSNMADLQNIGGMPAGSVTAACFLSKFVDDIPWAHLDIAGTAWIAGKEPAGSGRPVPLLMHYLKRQADQTNQ